MDKLVRFFLCCLAFIFPWQEMAVVPYVGTGTNIVGALAFATALGTLVTGRKLRNLPLALITLGIFIVWCWATIVWSIGRDTTLRYCISLSQLWIFCWLVWDFVRTPEQALWLLRFYLFGCLLALGMLLLHFGQADVSEMTEDTRGFSGGGMNPNAYAALQALAVPIALYMANHFGPRRAWQRWFYWAIIPARCSASCSADRAAESRPLPSARASCSFNPATAG